MKVFYPTNVERNIDRVITLSDDKLATWRATGVNGASHADVIGCHAILLDAAGKPLAMKAAAHTAKFAVWVNVATRYSVESKLAGVVRKAAGKRGEVKLTLGDSEKLATEVKAIAAAVVAAFPETFASKPVAPATPAAAAPATTPATTPAAKA